MSTVIAERPMMARHDLRPPIRDGRPVKLYSLRIDPRHLLLVGAVKVALGEVHENHEPPDNRGVFETALEYYATAILGTDHVAAILQRTPSEEAVS